MSGVFELISLLNSHCDVEQKPSSKVILDFYFSAELGIVYQLHQNSAAISNLLILFILSPCFFQDDILQWALNLHKSLGLRKSLGYIRE